MKDGNQITITEVTLPPLPPPPGGIRNLLEEAAEKLKS